MKSLQVYSRPGCHLCEQLIEELLPLVRGHLAVDVRDIDSRDDWRAAFDTRVPVVEFNGEFVCEQSLDKDALNRILVDYRGRGI
jgi:hypothetical protein